MAVVAIILFVLGVVAPRRSRRVQQAVDGTLERGKRAADQAPNPVDDLVRKPLEESEKATDKSSTAGRKARFRLPG